MCGSWISFYFSMAECAFKILSYVNEVPAMAGCTECGTKFFAPKYAFGEDGLRAEEYLRDKFVQHQCSRPDVHRAIGWHERRE
jgi:hypothetical protein